MPGHRELLPVLWDMGILPEVRIAGSGNSTLASRGFASKEDAIEAQLGALDGAEKERARRGLEDHFEEFFRPAFAGGFARRRARTHRPRQIQPCDLRRQTSPTCGAISG